MKLSVEMWKKNYYIFLSCSFIRKRNEKEENVKSALLQWYDCFHLFQNKSINVYHLYVYVYSKQFAIDGYTCRTIFRQRNHISPHFTVTVMLFSILKKNVIISLKLVVKAYWNSLTKEERNLFLYKIKKLLEIQNKWRNMVTWRNMVLHSRYINARTLGRSVGVTKSLIYSPKFNRSFSTR